MQGGRPFTGHLAAQQGLDVGDLETRGPVDQKTARRTGQRADQHPGFIQRLGDDALFQRQRIVRLTAGIRRIEAGRQLQQAPCVARVSAISASGARSRRRNPPAARGWRRKD
jgi:hypothetical protein